MYTYAQSCIVYTSYHCQLFDKHFEAAHVQKLHSLAYIIGGME